MPFRFLLQQSRRHLIRRQLGRAAALDERQLHTAGFGRVPGRARAQSLPQEIGHGVLKLAAFIARSLISRTRSLGKSNVVFMEPFCWFPSFQSTRALDALDAIYIQNAIQLLTWIQYPACLNDKVITRRLSESR